MHKQVLAIEDLSCVGKCSLTVALPILSAMGLSCSVLPTAVLSTHTGFPEPHIRSLTEDILPIAHHWQSAGAVFGGISVGYLSDPEQARQVEQLLTLFPALTLLDPVLGDGGRLYSGIIQAHVEAMRTLCTGGKILLPNVTEAAVLTGLPYRTGDSTYYRELLDAMMDFSPMGVVITGTEMQENSTGFVGISRETGPFSYSAPKIPRQLHGTGDMFSAVTLGRLVQGSSLKAAAVSAAAFVEKVAAATPKETPFGANFEQLLPTLWTPPL